MSRKDDEHVESSIVREFENLQVLATYDFQKMDALVQDLTNVLEEAARSQKVKNAEGSPQPSASTLMRRMCKKRRNKKRRSNQNPMRDHGNISEASESSLDEALKDYMENIAQQSDSDDLLLTVRRLPSLLNFPNQPLSLAESDSVTESFSSNQPHHRRKRKCKRMAIDPQPGAQMPETAVCSPKTKPKSVHCKLKNPLQMHDGMDIENKDVGELDDLSDPLAGKRKRTFRDRSFDLEGVNADEQTEGATAGPQATMECGAQVLESSSSLSSSESEGLFTNDEGRDGDDEQSDFFHETGPACGIEGIIPWWETGLDEVTKGLDSVDSDPNFDCILKGSFHYLSQAAQSNFKARLKSMGKSGREIRSGRRRLKEKRPPYSLSRFLQDRQQWGDSSKKLTSQCWQGSNGSGTSNNDPKRRRKTPPSTPPGETVAGAMVGGNADPIPDSNIGNRMLQNMGWTPGTGLGSAGSGITTPIVAYKRPARMGLGGDGAKS